MNIKTLLSLTFVALTFHKLQAQNALHIPPTLSGTSFELTIDESTKQFFDGQATETIGFNGNFLGPTLIFNSGDFIDIRVNNNLSETTTVHWHGMHVAPEDDGGPHTVIAPGTVWAPDFTVLDRATTFWYHPHLHEKTNEHVSKGAAGLIIVRSGDEAELTLPRTYGVDDIPLIVQGKSFNGNNQLEYAGPNADDNVIMVNGTLDPYMETPAQLIRYRLLNGSNERVLNFGFSDDRSFQQIGSDGGLLSAPVTMNRLQLASGERAEIVVDFSTDNEGTTVEMFNYASEFGPGIPGGPRGGGVDGLDGADTKIIEFRVIAQNSNPVMSISTNLSSHTPWLEQDAVVTRTITMDGGGGPGNAFNLDNALFDMNFINETVLLDDIEIWTITNNTNLGHPFHIHDVQFYILDRNGQAPPENERGLKDVVFVGSDETVRFITKFEDFADPDVPYMYHCHILPHEDGGMMGQFIVVESEDPGEVTGIEDVRSQVRVYPNPVKDRIIRVLLPDGTSADARVSFSIFDMSGQRVEHFASSFCGPNNLKVLYLSDFRKGMFTLVTNIDNETVSKVKMIIE